MNEVCSLEKDKVTFEISCKIYDLPEQFGVSTSKISDLFKYYGSTCSISDLKKKWCLKV